MTAKVVRKGLVPPGTHHVETEAGQQEVLPDEPGTGVLLVLHDEDDRAYRA
ncbi:hypothetical protein GCM10017674_14830 [Streptomyces gardneri]|uniref:Uncharacterized protein n=1 Tax=Streptomyces gardneri TaxID=66892 RepID=A0A4Y3RA20_9ACTN|nr:hypothetical protein SGA01_01760 [Streptomyces gardneri]GHG88613.1 hypothetical protein GCM10017674_14830 [Streptomyces gardneri]